MSVVKVSIKDKNTLELQEDAKKGDEIDLSCLSPADVGGVSEALKAAAKKEVEQEIANAKANELRAELLKQEKELSEKHNNELLALEVEKNKYALIVKQQTAQLESEKSLARAEMQNEILSLKSELEKKDGVLKFELERKANEIKTLEEQMRHQKETGKLETERVIEEIKQEKDKINAALTKEVEFYRDYKLKQNVKMLGETLEKHCDIVFETIRGFLPANIEYGKDTVAVEGSMGDRIYREFNESGEEILSIMFEMKNEQDATATKKTNESFLKELDKDRKQKKCEYAVLVSLLERDNDIYDTIYTVPDNKFKDMYIIRPQHFTQIIMWLRNVTNKLAVSRNELQEIQRRDLDLTAFDIQAGLLRDKFSKHYQAAVNRHNDAVTYIDKTIKELQKIRDALESSDRQLGFANADLEDLTAKKLAKNSPGILEQIKKNKEDSRKSLPESKKK